MEVDCYIPGEPGNLPFPFRVIGLAHCGVGGPHIQPLLGSGTNSEACCLFNIGLSKIDNETVVIPYP